MAVKGFFICLVIIMGCFKLLRFAESKLPQEEVDALTQITSTLGARYWKFNGDSCQIEMVGLTTEAPRGSENSIVCDCPDDNSSVCHVVSIVLKGYSLPGMLPPQLTKLPYLREIDFAYNYLNGTIPQEWASLQLTSISVLVNRLSGKIPKELGNLTTLTFLNLEVNRFSGVIPPELGRLVNLQNLLLSSNQLTGNLPMAFARLVNLTDLRINDNSFNGRLPDFIQNWKRLKRLEMHASGLEGPLPQNISLLSNLVELRVSDMHSLEQDFPKLEDMTNLVRLVLRNCNIFGEIPPYIWRLKNLEMLDVSFNKLVGEIPVTINLERLKFLFLTGNSFSGSIPDTILKDGTNVDLSYNNFTYQSPGQPTCQDNMNLNLNLFRSSSVRNNLKAGLPCLENFNCPRYSTCFHVNCGGKDVIIEENKKNVLYRGDGQVEGGSAEYFLSDEAYWGFSSTGDFMDDNDYQNTRYIATLHSENISLLYTTARVSPVSLTYFHYCLENRIYTINLHFAEIQFTNDQTYLSLGKRMFDVYVQERLVWKDFNIEAKAGIAQKPVMVPVYNVSVANNVLEIQFYFSGKGTTRIPDRGVYGPLISAISVFSDSKHCSDSGSGTSKSAFTIAGVVIGVLCLIFVLLGIFWWKGCLQGKRRRKREKGQDLQSGTFTLKQIIAATNDFDYANKIGEGGFGPVYKGQLPDGTSIAVKQLSSKSRQGNREFLNEMGVISCLQHPNLVKLYGCCIEADQLLLVYEFMENNSLARALFGPDNQLELDWPTRHKICVGIAKGLAFLHEESRLKIVHRDIKATNVLLDRDFSPKISDFGLAKLDEEGKTHISTRIAGTIGYMAPEYALWGHLTYKADVYSYGVVVLEVVSGKNNKTFVPSNDCVCLLDWACQLQRAGSLMELVYEKLGPELDKKEAEIVVKVALLCTNASPSIRPTMSEVVSMLEGRMTIPDVIPEPSSYTDDLRFKAMRDLHRERQNESLSGSQNQYSFRSSFTSGQDFREIKPELMSS